MGALAQNMSENTWLSSSKLPLRYAKEVLDVNHNVSLSIQEASKDLNFQCIIDGNISLILTQNFPNDTKLLKPEYNPNKNAYMDIDTELKPTLIEKAKSFFLPSSSSSESSGKCTNLEVCP